MKKEKSSEKKKNMTQKEALLVPSHAAEGSGADPNEKYNERVGVRDIFLSLTNSIAKDPTLAAAGFLRGVLFAVAAFLFGRTPLLLDTYPLAIALLSSAKRNVLFILIGACVSVFAVDAGNGVIFSPMVYLPAYIMIVFIRIAARMFIDPPNSFSAKRLLSPKSTWEIRKSQLKQLYISRFEENAYLKMATACVAAFLVSLYALREGEYRYYDLFSAMFAMIGAPAITYIFSGIWESGEEKGERLYREISAGALLTAAVFALRESYILGVNGAAFLTFFALMYASERKNILFCSALGLSAGLAFSPMYSPAFVLAAIARGTVKRSRFASFSAASAVAILWGAYIDGFGAFTSLMPAVLSASVFAVGAEMLVIMPRETKDREYRAAASETLPVRSEEQMELLSAAFSELSKALYDISDRIHSPGMTEAREISLRAFEASCNRCGKCESCKNGNYGEFSEMVTKTGETLLRDGRLKKQKLPEYVSDRCTSIDSVIEEANTLFAELIRSRVTGEKTELIALDYEAVSHIISDAVAYSRAENELDGELTDRLRRFGKLSDIGVRGVSARGQRKKRILCTDLGRRAEDMGTDELRRELEDACGFPLKELVFELHDGRVGLRTESARRFSVESGMAMRASGGEGVCGDTALAFENRNDNFYAMISDGMGSGQSAFFTSEICGLFMNKMLMAGNKKETCIKMLNTLLRSKGEECSASVDLMELDLISGKASFIKSGAAPSFVKRGDKLYKIRSETAPIGIMRGIDAEQVRFDVEDSDVIIMLSDGVSQTPEECLWLMELLGSPIEEDLTSVAEKICERSAEEGSRDDISVMLLRVKK
ncbi:MAG: SpoIIE family protein phosphatase [Clostridia bacterium]|nr:SpoIIE family protein phosphatase [Clostridia bacterium]